VPCRAPRHDSTVAAVGGATAATGETGTTAVAEEVGMTATAAGEVGMMAMAATAESGGGCGRAEASQARGSGRSGGDA
jgi:hypothetical protein